MTMPPLLELDELDELDEELLDELLLEEVEEVDEVDEVEEVVKVEDTQAASFTQILKLDGQQPDKQHIPPPQILPRQPTTIPPVVEEVDEVEDVDEVDVKNVPLDELLEDEEDVLGNAQNASTHAPLVQHFGVVSPDEHIGSVVITEQTGSYVPPDTQVGTPLEHFAIGSPLDELDTQFAIIQSVAKGSAQHSGGPPNGKHLK